MDLYDIIDKLNNRIIYIIITIIICTIIIHFGIIKQIDENNIFGWIHDKKAHILIHICFGMVAGLIGNEIYEFINL